MLALVLIDYIHQDRPFHHIRTVTNDGTFREDIVIVLRILQRTLMSLTFVELPNKDTGHYEPCPLPRTWAPR